MGSPKFPKKVHLDTQYNFGNCGIYVYVHDRLGSPKKNSWLRPQKHYVYCTLLMLLAGPEIATKHTGCPKKTKLALCALHSWAKCQKNRQKLDFKKSWNWQTVLMPATVWQFLECKSNPPKMENRCEFAGICLEKLVKWHQLNLFCGGF